jgi:hypothetical protein
MAMGGDGPWTVTVMWVLTAVVLIFVILRIYARAVIVKSYGTEDHVFVLAFVGKPGTIRSQFAIIRSKLSKGCCPYQGRLSNPSGF